MIIPVNIPQFDLAIIDGDVIVCRAGFAVEKESYNKEMDIKEITVESLDKALYNCHSIMSKILTKLNPIETITYLTASKDKTNFRYQIYSLYKANRVNSRRAIYIKPLRQFLINKYNAKIKEGQEADDSCSIAQIKAQGEFKTPVLVSIDKDFDNVAGWHYNPVKGTLYYITEIQALKNKYLQILIGDITDDIPRIRFRWLKKKVEQELNKALTEDEMYEIIYKELHELHFDHSKVNWIIQDFNTYDPTSNIAMEILARGRLVHLRHYEEELWTPNLTMKDKIVTIIN